MNQKSMDTLQYFLFVLILCFANCKYSSTQKVSPFYLDDLLNKSFFDEFINILQIPNIDLVDPSQRKSDSVMQFFYNGLQFNDILLRPGQVLNPDQAKYFNGTVKYSFKKWTNGIVPYYISNALSSFTYDQKIQINREISESNNLLGPNVVFRQYQPGDKDYVYIFNGGCGWFSNIGKVGGAQVISLTPPLVEGLLKHEMQHTLGFTHENNRKDRDEFIRIHPENLSEILKPQYIKFTSDNMVNSEPYDYNSIMHFPVKVLGFNLTAFDVFKQDIDTSLIGEIFTLKASDIQRVKTEYPLHI